MGLLQCHCTLHGSFGFSRLLVLVSDVSFRQDWLASGILTQGVPTDSFLTPEHKWFLLLGRYLEIKPLTSFHSLYSIVILSGQDVGICCGLCNIYPGPLSTFILAFLCLLEPWLRATFPQAGQDCCQKHGEFCPAALQGVEAPLGQAVPVKGLARTGTGPHYSTPAVIETCLGPRLA